MWESHSGTVNSNNKACARKERIVESVGFTEDRSRIATPSSQCLPSVERWRVGLRMLGFRALSEASSTGVSRTAKEVSSLDAFFDTNEKRYFITQLSVELAVQEELSKLAPVAKQASPGKERVEERKSFPKVSETSNEVEELRGQLLDLEITNRVKVIKTYVEERQAIHIAINGAQQEVGQQYLESGAHASGRDDPPHRLRAALCGG
jgi:hypothetical protein